MPIKGDELAKMSIEEILELAGRKCVKCNSRVNLNEEMVQGHCPDCYYEIIGRHFEENPLFFRPYFN